MKSFGVKPWMMPQPDVAKMNLIAYEPVSHSYVALGEEVSNAFSDGKKLK